MKCPGYGEGRRRPDWMFGLPAQRNCPTELREQAMQLVVEARADTLTCRGAFTRIGGRARGPPTGVAHLGALWSRTGAMSAARSAIRSLISASWKQRTGSCAAPMRSSKPVGAPERMSCGSGQPPFRRPRPQRVVGRRHPLRARAGRLSLRLLRHQRVLAQDPGLAGEFPDAH